MSTLRHGRWQLAAAATQPRRAGGRSPQWVLAVLVSRTLEMTSVQASRVEQSAERTHGGGTLCTERALWDLLLPVETRAAPGLRSAEAEVNLPLAALRKMAEKVPAATARLVSADDTAHRVAGTQWGVPLAVVEGAMSRVLILVARLVTLV